MLENTSAATVVKGPVTSIPRDEFGKLLAIARKVCKEEPNDEKAIKILGQRSEHPDKPLVLHSAIKVARKETAETPRQKEVRRAQMMARTIAKEVVEKYFKAHPDENRKSDKIADDIMATEKPHVGHSEIVEAVNGKKKEMEMTAMDAVTTYFTNHPADILGRYEDIADRISDTVSKVNLVRAIGSHLKDFAYEDRKKIVFNHCVHMAIKILEAGKKMPKALAEGIKSKETYLYDHSNMVFAACCEALNKKYPRPVVETVKEDVVAKPAPKKNPGSAARKMSKAKWIAAGCPKGKNKADKSGDKKGKNNKGGSGKK